MIGPDFLCIGAVKAGTQWLYDQARSHPDCWMTPIKELHYFNLARDGRFPLPMMVKHGIERRARHDARARSFFAALNACEGFGIEPDLYRNLFVAKGDKISGDVSPGYCALPADQAARMVAMLPGVRFVFIARDPVARAWSDICMLVRHRMLNVWNVKNEAWLRAYLHDTRMRDLAHPAATLATWCALLPPERFRVFDFGLTARDPAAQRKAIFEFIELDSAKSGPLAPDFDVKKGNRKIVRTPSMERVLRDEFAFEAEAFKKAVLSDCAPWCVEFSAETLGA